MNYDLIFIVCIIAVIFFSVLRFLFSPNKCNNCGNCKCCKYCKKAVSNIEKKETKK